jgi:hypothetical protein
MPPAAPEFSGAAGGLFFVQPQMGTDETQIKKLKRFHAQNNFPSVFHL